MNSTSRFAAACIVVTILTMCSALNGVAGPASLAGKRKSSKVQRFATELNLTDEQLQKIQQIESAQEISAVEMRAKVKVAEIELRDLMHEQDVDEGSVIAKVKEIGGLKTDLRIAGVRSKLAINRVLTTEQLQTLRSLDRKKGKRGRNRRDARRGGKKTHGDDLPGLEGPDGQELDMELPQPEPDNNREI